MSNRSLSELHKEMEQYLKVVLDKTGRKPSRIGLYRKDYLMLLDELHDGRFGDCFMQDGKPMFSGVPITRIG